MLHRLGVLIYDVLVVSALIALCAFTGSYDLKVIGDVSGGAVQEVRQKIDHGLAQVQNFFGTGYKQRFDVLIVAHRELLDREVARRWKAPKTEKWMVAAGTASVLIMLDPTVWKTEAVGHDPADQIRLGAIVTHELVHVFHGQQNPNHEFDGMDEMAWFIEGLATYASDQLKLSGTPRAVEAVGDSQWPSKLANAWSGRYRYVVSGSLVEYLDKTLGRERLRGLLKAQKNSQILAALKMTEERFLAGAKPKG